jgi:hypothetical protein
MTNNARRCAVTAALSGALLIAVAACPFAHPRIEAATGIQVSQYCVPQEPTFDAHRFYCGIERTPVGLPEHGETALT